MDLLDELGKYLDSSGLGTYDDADPENNTIFVGKHPPSPDACISLLGTTGRQMGPQRDVPELQLPLFQVLTRDSDYNTAAARLQAVRAALHGKLQLVLPVGVNTTTQDYIRVMRCHADQEGGSLGDDSEGRFEFSINFTVEYHAVINT